MRGANQHLSGEEIEQLAGIAPDVAVGALEGAMRHLERCEHCRFRMLLSEQDLSRVPLKLGKAANNTGNLDCPPESTWLEVAAGLGTKAERKRYMEHAASCARCGQLLKQAVEDVGMELTDQEEAKVAALNSAQPEWQGNLAQRIADEAPPNPPVLEKPVRSSKRFVFWPRWAAAFAALILAAGGGWWAWILLRAPSVEELLAQAYTEQRTIEMRIPGAKYAPMRVERGQQRSRLNRPSALLDAEATIRHHLESQPGDTEWLGQRGRAELLENDFRSAIATLARAHERDPNSLSVTTDLAAAYFEQAEEEDRSIDYGTVIQLLGEVLQKDPDEKIALFNRAVACERMFLYTQAVDDWKHYLRVDPDGAWADDARRRLAAVNEKLQQHEKSQAEPLLNPREFAKSVMLSRGEGFSGVDQRAEEYLNIAVQEWLPAAFPERESTFSANSRVEARLALKLLANLLASRHQDRWLTDLLEAASSTTFSQGIWSLSRAAAANVSGEPDLALAEAHRAEQLFQSVGSRPGVIRAGIEEIYALHRQYHLRACLAKIIQMAKATHDGSYQWITIQMDLEHYACGSSALESNGQLLVAARNSALQAKYGTLYLRALGFSASSETGSGATEKAWVWDRTGLEKYWSGPYPPLRAQHFYDDLSIGAQDSSQWLLAVVLEREAVVAIAASPNRTGEGMERIELARSASNAQLWEEATQQYSQALAVFSSLPQDKSTRAFRASAEIGLAEVALSQKRIQEAEYHLRYARENMPPDFEEDETWLSLYRTLAQLRKQGGEEDGAGKAWKRLC